MSVLHKECRYIRKLWDPYSNIFDAVLLYRLFWSLLLHLYFFFFFFSFLQQNILIEPVWWCISQFAGFDLHLVNNLFHLDQLSVTFSFFSVATSVFGCDWFSVFAQTLLYVLISNKKNTCFRTWSEICSCSSSSNLYLRLPFEISLTIFICLLNWIPLSTWLWLP